ncbi:hypothetical protein SAMN04489743_1098 [Pseudarthrobacter equi]|uniref:Uncharacterized protein n=1 Tax=Pseudarthrobacter equi TaxID=728066 RepID=A0A1H1VUD5_9MICC|nr:hypothetical protein [Pseudarthrobacter equi]SDS87876.1 hypothetical protein SAMN04489743_1098 [Pseudarthrobacter equi]
MMIQLPGLAPNVRYRGPKDGPDIVRHEEGEVEWTVLWARYIVDGFAVSIGWDVGHPMGDFREPNKLTIEFDEVEYGTSENPSEESFEGGITTSLLRSIPMAHARALMREHHEQLSVASVRDEWAPFPSRVETDRDYTYVAAAYVALMKVSVEPIKRLAEWTDESIDTWSARLRRARAKGILEGKGRQAKVAPAYLQTRDQIWADMRARKEKPNGH